MGSTSGVNKYPVATVSSQNANSPWTFRYVFTETYNNPMLVFFARYINNLFVVGGTSSNGGWYAFSPDGITWTKYDAGSAGAMGTALAAAFPIRDVVWNGSNYFFITGTATNQIWKTSDLNTAPSISGISQPFGANQGVDLIYNSTTGLMVATSNNYQIATSTDGLTWTLRTLTGGSAIVRVTYDRGLALYYATSTASTTNDVHTSTDGFTWTGRGVQGLGWRPVGGNGIVYFINSGSLIANSTAATLYNVSAGSQSVQVAASSAATVIKDAAYSSAIDTTFVCLYNQTSNYLNAPGALAALPAATNSSKNLTSSTITANGTIAPNLIIPMPIAPSNNTPSPTGSAVCNGSTLLFASYGGWIYTAPWGS